MATHCSSTLLLKIPWTLELGAGYYPWGRKVSGTTERLHFHFHSTERERYPETLSGRVSTPITKATQLG